MSSSPIPQAPRVCYYIQRPERGTSRVDNQGPNSKGLTKGQDNKRTNRSKYIAAAVNKQVEKTLSAAIKATEAESSPDAQTNYQARVYRMSLLKDTKG